MHAYVIKFIGIISDKPLVGTSPTLLQVGSSLSQTTPKL